ncbi:MAG: MBOAT family protein [Myxococcales bacterium]|nr:MBOAT family protein [Myxococcales bacterium]
MSFTSLEFGAFLVVVYALYAVLPHRAQNAMLFLASYFFYGYWDYRFLGLIAFSTVVDYTVALRLASTEDAVTRKRLVGISLLTNLGLLGVFKYYNFFADSAEHVAASLGVELHWTTTHIVLPVGISFYTFQTLSYTIDVYRRELPACKNVLDFALFVSFFPQLVAGPIERASHLLPAIAKPRRIVHDDVARGAFLILFGLFKKVAVADGFAASVDAIYNAPGANAFDVLLATYLFAFQIFCDFSGYSDIARGIAKTLGFELMNNFDQPYAATNPREFWRRWHISLSSWLRDYLYISLGGSRGGPRTVYMNLMLTMVLGGLWHGAAWNFVLWGIFQGAVLCIHRAFAGPNTEGVPQGYDARAWLGFALKAALYFQVTCYGWLLFRAGSFAQIWDFTGLLVAGWGDELTLHVPRPPLAALMGFAILTVMGVARLFAATPRFYRAWPEPLRAGLVAAMCVVALMGLSTESHQFIYFQF